MNLLVDMVWYLIHIYRPNLDRSTSSKAFIGQDDVENVELHRRTYKKMLEYFEEKNDQLVLQKQVAEELRNHLNVEEGLRCLIWGKPELIDKQRIELYESYAISNNQKPKLKKNQTYAQRIAYLITTQLKDGPPADDQPKEAEDPEKQKSSERPFAGTDNKPTDINEFFGVERLVSEFETLK